MATNTVQLHCGGPASIFVAVQGGTPVGLGHCKEAPLIYIQRLSEQVDCDIAGKAGFDESYQGQRGFLNLTLSRFNQAALDLIEQYPHSGQGVSGFDGPGDIGCLPGTEGRALILWIAAPYALKSAMAGDPAGWRFLNCHPIGEPEKIRTSTLPTEINLSFKATRSYNPRNGAHILYDRNMTGIPAVL